MVICITEHTIQLAGTLQGEAENKAETCNDFRELAGSILEKLNDKKWVKKNYIKAEEKAEDCDNFLSLAESIYKNLSDKKCSISVYKKAEEKAEDTRNFSYLADSINVTSSSLVASSVVEGMII